jgi:hypothetical protein
MKSKIILRGNIEIFKEIYVGNVLLLRNTKIGIFEPLAPIVTQNPPNAVCSVRFCNKVRTSPKRVT